MGIAAYPEGHPKIDSVTLLADLLAKQVYADYAVLQLTFDPEALLRWLERGRQQRFRLPVYLCLSGMLRLDRLLRIGLRLWWGPHCAT